MLADQADHGQGVQEAGCVLGVRFDQGVIAEAMLKNGFRQVRSRTITTPMGPMDLDIALK